MAGILDKAKVSSSGILKTSGSASKSTSKSTKEYLQSQIDNYKKRLQAIGVDPEEATDSRNALEKALNLEEDQNVLFDIFEILGRPQQALFGGIKEVQEGGSFLAGAKAGWSGEEDTQFKDILANAGMNEDNLGTKALGFLGDVFLDPADLALIPVTGGASLVANGLSGASKGLKAVDTISDVSKGLKAVDTASDVSKGLKVADNIQDILSGGATISNDIQKTTNLISPIEGVFKLAGKGIKGAANVADKGIEGVLKGLDAKTLNTAKNAIDTTGKTADEITQEALKYAQKAGLNADRLGSYRALKSGLTKSSNASKTVQGLAGIANESRAAADYAKDLATKQKKLLMDDTYKYAERIASETGQNVDDVFKQTAKIINDTIEKGSDTSIDGARFFQNLTKESSKANTFKATKESVQAMADTLTKYEIPFEINKEGTQLVVKTSKVKNLKYLQSNPEIVNAFKKLNLNFDLGYNAEDIAELKKYENIINSDEELKALYDRALNATPQASNTIEKATGVTYKPVVERQNYLARTTNKLNTPDKAPTVVAVKDKGFENQFGSRKDPRAARVREREYQEKRLKQEEQFAKREENIKAGLYENKKTQFEQEIERLEGVKVQKKEILEKNMTKLDKSSNLARESIAKANRSIQEVKDSLVIDSNKALKKIEDKALTNKIAKDKVAYKQSEKVYKDLLNRLQNTELSPKEIDSLEKAFDRESNNLLRLQKSLENSINKVDNYTFKNTSDILKKQDITLDINRKSTEEIVNFKANLGKTNVDGNAISKSINKAEKTRKAAADSLTNEIIKKTNRIKDTALKTDLSSTIKKINDSTKKCDDIVNKLSRGELSDSEISKLQKQLDKATKELDSNKLKLDADIARVNGYVDEKTEKLLNSQEKAIEKVRTQQTKIAKADGRLADIEEMRTLLRQNNADQIANIDKKIRNLRNAMGGLDPAQDANVLKKLEDLAYQKSIFESNADKVRYETDFFTNLGTFIDKGTEYAASAKVYNEAVSLGTLSNSDFVVLAKEVNDVKPQNFVKVDGSLVAEQLNNFKDFLPEDSSKFNDLIKRFEGNTLYMDKDLANVLRLGSSDEQKVRPLVNFIDKINNTFKRFKTFTLGSQMRNAIGSPVNMYLSGMPVHKIATYEVEAAKILNNAEDLTTKFINGVEFTADEAKQWSYLSDFFKAGFTEKGFEAAQDLDTVRETMGKATNVVSRALDKATDINFKVNNAVDSANRLALFMYAKDTPKYVSKLGVKDAAEAVRYTLFDPSNLSDFEKNVMKKIVPFYTFTKQNLYFQATNIMKNTPKYNRLLKSINSLYNEVGEDNYYEYQKNGMQIPLPWTDENGNQMFLKANLPLSDLGEWLSNPLSRSVSSVTPIIKTPIEMASGVDTFTGQDLSTKKSGAQYFAESAGIDLPDWAQNSSQVASQILAGLGLDTITTNMVKKVSKVIDSYNGEADPQEVWAEIFRSLFQNVNQEKIENSKLYEEMEAYQSIMDKLKNQGIDVPTIKEITASNQIKLNNFTNKRNKNNIFS